MKMNIRKILALLASVAMLLTVLPLGAMFVSAEATNLVNNGDFETGNADGWSTSTNSTITVVDNAGGFGNYSAYVEYKDDWGSIFQYVNVEKNTDYVYTYKVKADSKFQMITSVMGSDWGTSLAKGSEIPCTGDWDTVSIEFNSGNFSTIIIFVQSQHTADKNHTAYVDDVSVIKKSDLPEEPETPAVENLVANGDFTDGKNGWSVDDWCAGSVSIVDNNGDAAVCLDGGWVNVKQNVALEANTDYVLSFYYIGKPVYYLKAVGLNGAWPDAAAEATLVTYEFNSGDVTSVELEIGSSDGTTYVDKVVLVKKAAAEPEEPPVVVEPSNDGYITNGDFETGDLTGGWEGKGIAVSESAAKDGKYGVHLTGGEWDGLCTWVNVEPNTDYILYYDYNQTVSDYFGAFIKNQDKSGDVASTWPNGEAGKWHTVKLQFNSGNNSKIFLQLCTGANREQFIDNVKIVKVKEPSNDGYLKNGDFETGDASYWDSMWDATTNIVEGHNSQYAAEVTASTWNSLVQSIKVEKNKDYTITFWAKKGNGTPAFTMLIKAEQNIAETFMNQVGDEWTEYTFDFNVGENESVNVMIMANDGASKGTIVIDDIVITEKAVEEPEVSDDGYFVNGDFETGDLTGGWDTDDGATVTDAQAHSGKYSVSSNKTASKYQTMLTRTGIAVKKNTQYQVSFWYYYEGTNAAPSFYLYVQADDGQNTNISSKTTNPAAVGEWKQVTLEFNTGDYDLIIFYLKNRTVDDGGTYYFDDITMMEVREPSFDGYITNGDFECGTTTKWETKSDNVFKVVAGAGVDGSNAGYIEYNCDWGNIYQYVKVEKNTDYVYSFKAKADAGFQMILSVQGNDWATSLAKATQDCTGEWVEYSVEFNSGNFSDIIVYVQSNHTADAGHKVYVDDITIVEKTDVPPAVEESYDGHIYNGDFESGVLGDNWVLTSAGTSGISADAAKAGKYGFLISGSAWAEILTSMGFDVEAGVTYTVSFDAMTLKNGGRMNFQVKSPSNPANPGAGNSVVTEYIDLTTNWKTYTYEFTQGANPYGSLLFVSQGNDFYIDNVKVTNDKKPDPETPAVGFVNGDFETGDASGWETWQDTIVSEEASYNGNYGANLKGNGGWGGMLNQTITGLTVGNQYTISFMLKVNATGVNIQVKENNNGGASIAGCGGWYDVNKAGEWTKIEYTFVATTADVFVNFCGGGNGKAEDVYVDDFVLIDPNAGSEPAVDFVNGDFETGDKTGWETWQSTVISEEASYGGNYGANLIGDGGWGGMLNQTITGLTVGNTYVMSFMIKANSAGVNVQVKENNSGGNKIADCGGYYDTNKVGEWTKIEYTFVATTADVFVNFCGSGTNKAENIFVDDFKLVDPNAGSEPSENPIKNFGFETGDLTDWINLYSACTVEFVEPGYDNSKYALKVTTNGAWQQVRQNKIPVEPNTDYVVELYYRNADGMGVVIKEGNDSFDLTAFEAGQIPTDLTNTWKKHVFEFNTGVNKDGESIDPIDSICLLLIAPAGDCSAEIDNIRLIKKSEYQSDELDGPIVNPGFETGDLTGWTNLWGSCEVDFDSPGHNKSKYAMNFKGTGAWQQVRQDNVAVEPNTDYTLVAYLKNSNNINLVVKTGDDSANIADYSVKNDNTSAWIRHEVSFNSGNETKVCVLVITNADGNGTALVDNVQIYKKGEEPAEPEPEVPVVPMTMLSYGVLNNRPMTADKNLITNGSFETNDGWTAAFLGNTLSIVDDDTTRFGNKSLYFNTTGVEENNKHIFYVNVEPNTNYVFSTWIKGAYISDDNRFNATIGVVNPDNGKYLTTNDWVFTTNKRQLVPTAWDNEWHLRSISFNTGSSTKVGIALFGSYTQMWVDDLALFKVEDGKKYMSANMAGNISPTFGETEFNGSDDDKGLIPDPTFTKGDSTEFWTTGTGWGTGFMSFAENKFEYGNSLKYTATAKKQGHYFTKWVDVEPETEYIFAVDVKILESGAGKLSLLDGKIRHNVSFLDVDFNIEDYGDEWFTMIVSFNTNVYDTIGIAVVDLGGSALIDNIRLFKAEDGKVVEDDFIARADGWYKENGQWVYYLDGYKATNKWVKDSKGWCYLGEDGYMVYDKWVADSIGWCYVGSNGYMVTNKWVRDSVGWCYVGADGYCVTDKWVADSIGWCYLDSDGRMVTNKWVKDSVGWCYIGEYGYCVTSKWVKDSVGWCYVDADGRMVTNKWIADSYGWCYLGSDGRMVTDKWVKDSKGWCYIGSDGYCVTSSWVQDSKGLCYVDANGRMVYNTWVDGYYVNANGYYEA